MVSEISDVCDSKLWFYDILLNNEICCVLRKFYSVRIDELLVSIVVCMYMVSKARVTKSLEFCAFVKITEVQLSKTIWKTINS